MLQVVYLQNSQGVVHFLFFRFYQELSISIFLSSFLIEIRFKQSLTLDLVQA